jgi:hypothetical protein
MSKKTDLQQVVESAWAIVLHPKSNRIEKLEGLKLVCAARGILLPEISERWLSTQQAVQLRQAKQELIDKALRCKTRRKRENRRTYLRRQLKNLEEQGCEPQNDQLPQQAQEAH